LEPPGPRSASRIRGAANLAEAVEDADVVLVCVSDEALGSVVGALARAVQGRRRKPVVLVTSGYRDLGELRRRIGRGVALGRFHPLTPVFAGSLGFVRGTFGVEGDARARRVARALLPHWDAKALELRPGRADRYHAGAALLGGGTVALFSLAEACMAPAVRSRRSDLRLVLGRFATDNVHHSASRGAVRALTGPLARGSESVARGHLRALRAVPEALAAYRALGVTMLALARARGSIDAPTERRLRRLLSARRSAAREGFRDSL
jgi:predicted short-subunit dehydrogenase-like oxidoreductase (DUF2520 family)